MPRHRRYLFLSLAAVVVGLLIGVWLLWPRTTIRSANFDRIEMGMTLREVEIILGGQARDETTGPTQVDGLLPEALRDPEALRHTDDPAAGSYDTAIELFDQHGRCIYRTREWRQDYLAILVGFDAEERVRDRYAIPLRPANEEGLLERVRRWLGR